nr:hypothetical protein [uncultured Oscillibacter sp.]
MREKKAKGALFAPGPCGKAGRFVIVKYHKPLKKGRDKRRVPQ